MPQKKLTYLRSSSRHLHLDFVRDYRRIQAQKISLSPFASEYDSIEFFDELLFLCSYCKGSEHGPRISASNCKAKMEKTRLPPSSPPPCLQRVSSVLAQRIRSVQSREDWLRNSF